MTAVMMVVHGSTSHLRPLFGLLRQGALHLAGLGGTTPGQRTQVTTQVVQGGGRKATVTQGHKLPRGKQLASQPYYFIFAYCRCLF